MLPAYTHEENGYLHGTWFCGRPIAKYYGAFPMSFWPRAKAILGTDNMLHWFSGSVAPERGIVTVDGNPATSPSHVVLGTTLPFADGTFDSAFADPPYSPSDAKRYGLPYPPARTVLAEMARVTKPGGRIGLLHRFLPVSKHAPVKLLGVIGIMNGPQKAIRAFIVYERT